MAIGYDYDGVLTEPGWFGRMRADVARGEMVAVLTCNTNPEAVKAAVRAQGLSVPVVRFKRSDLEGKAKWLAAAGGGTLYDDDPKYGEHCVRHGVKWVRVG